ncbi:hypothetical protein G6O69_17170 [Pseudenhygromyxa sp. WMMC2535]|uniref:hypothetical protein n=1 Tax=Pseudenhygromyxa sp. WMMC2535 TaxID=2712867 RepID=UPI0015539516|nr:hypothetical protein [Pseudenhygromyxa sp. WMMC2535]NVB39577.1 hypothetical protein [Pseudenhygromyxa sp. WMMC2535]
MVEHRRPVVFLCPTRQLVEQVVAEAKHLGIPASHYEGGTPYPTPDATAGREVIVCTYDKLFNARSTFNRDDVLLRPCALVLDDAHAGVEKIRENFSLVVTDSSLDALLKTLKPGCKDHHPGPWKGIENGDRSAHMEVPFWIWRSSLEDIRDVLDPVGQKRPGVFSWGHLRDHLRWCRCVITGAGAEIFFDIPPVHLVDAFHRAEHRLYMSATLSDDSTLVRELGCSVKAASSPIIPASDKGVGERMVLVPALVDPSLDRDWVMSWAQGLASSTSIVVLTSNEKLARDWKSVGAVVEMGDGVTDTVQQLRSGATRFVAFANRYDGVDLPDDACRVLVIDGVPRGQGMAEEYDGTIPGRPGGTLRRWAYRIEQGMGRAVRSHADFAVVVLAGPDLANFLAKGEVMGLVGEGTRAQLKLADELADMARTAVSEAPTDAFNDMAMKCLNRDAGWRGFYDSRVRGTSPATPQDTAERDIEVAHAEHVALIAALDRRPKAAAEAIARVVNELDLEPEQAGWLLQRKANYTDEFDPATALQIQAGAHSRNRRLCPPPTGVVVRPPEGTGQVPAGLVLAWYNGFENPNGAIAAVESMKSRLSFDASPEALEQALLEVSAVFGATGSRPEKEYSRGPDDLWVWQKVGWVIEAKNERQGELPKHDGAQLLSSMQWFSQHYPEYQGTPIVVSRSDQAAHDATFPKGTRVLNPAGLNELRDNLTRFVAELATQTWIAWTQGRVADLLAKHGLQHTQFKKNYTVQLRT